jgi:hypothetical protein
VPAPASPLGSDADLNLSANSLRGGIGFLFVAVAALIGSPIAGAVLLAANNSYVAPCCFGGAMSTVGTVLLVLGRQTQVKRRGTNKV